MSADQLEGVTLSRTNIPYQGTLDQLIALRETITSAEGRTQAIAPFLMILRDILLHSS